MLCRPVDWLYQFHALRSLVNARELKILVCSLSANVDDLFVFNIFVCLSSDDAIILLEIEVEQVLKTD